MKKIFAAVLLALLAGCASVDAQQQNIQIFPTGPVFKISPSLAYNTSGPGGLNNIFFFTPLNLSESVCVFLKNNDTTNSASFNMSILATSDPANTTPTDGTWNTLASFVSLLAAAAPGQSAGTGVNVSGVSQVGVSITASTVGGGAPQTGQLVLIQTQGNCPSGNNFIGSAPAVLAANRPIQFVSQALAQGYSATASLVNPASGAQLIGINAQSGARTLYMDRLVIWATAAASVIVQGTSSAGATCTVITINNTRIQSSPVSTAVVNQACTTLPVVFSTLIGNASANFPLLANTPVTVDLTGFIFQAGQSQGLDIVLGAALAAGNINATLYWYEQ